MHIVSVVTLLLGSIFAFNFVSAQYGNNLAGLSSALAQLANQLAKESRNTTVTVGNNSVIVSGVSNANANAHIDRGNKKQGWNNGYGYQNGYYNNYGYGYWRGVPEGEEDLSAEEAALDEEERREREEEQRELAEEGNEDLGEEDNAHDLDAEGNYEEAPEEEHEEAHEEEHN